MRTMPGMLLLLLVAFGTAQDPALTKFTTEFTKALEYKDDKAMDRAVRTAPDRAIQHFVDLRLARLSGTKDGDALLDALRLSIPRALDKTTVTDHIDRWVEGQDRESIDRFHKVRKALYDASLLIVEAKKELSRPRSEKLREDLRRVVTAAEQTGFLLDAAEAWGMMAGLCNSMPDRNLDDKRESIAATERFLEHRRAWDWTKDQHFALNEAYVKGGKAQLEADEAAAKKREAEGYGKNVKGVDALVMPGVAEAMHELAFALHDDPDDLDYSQKGGPLPQFWWEVQFGQDSKEVKMPWFKRQELLMLRDGNDFQINSKAGNKAQTFPLPVGNKAKATQFFLDADHKMPYAIWTWIGTDREMLGESEVNLAPAPQLTAVFYKSAASWTTTIGKDTLTYYDDSTNGHPMDKDPMELTYKSFSTGSPTDGMPVPVIDSMRVNKGPRIPFSGFVEVGGAWVHQQLNPNGKVGVRPLNPEYVKSGKVKLNWSGPKPSAPVQLVIRGSGEYSTAFFDIAGGKEVTVPAAEYSVLIGRIMVGKGTRAQLATIYGGDSKPFVVEAGKVKVVEMGAPFTVRFERQGDDKEVRIDCTKILVADRSGALLTDFHGMTVVPEVVAAKGVDGKGAKVIGKFIKLTDGEILNKAAANEKYRNLGRFIALFPYPEGVLDGSTELKLKLPAGATKVGLTVKKHALLGKLDSAFL